MSIRLEEDGSYISFLRRNPRKLPKVEPAFYKGSQPRTKTGWLRWPFHRLEPLREERMKKARLKPIKDPGAAENDRKVLTDHAEHGRVMEAATEKRERRGVVVPIVSYSNDTMDSEKVKQNEFNESLKEVKRRPKQHSKCNDSIERNKRMSYPPCDTTGLHVYLERLQTNDHRNPKIPVSEVNLSQAFSTSCPALYNPKCADRIPRSELNYRRPDSRRHIPSQHAKAHGDKTLHDHVKTSKHHQKGSVEFPSEQTNIHKNHVKQKLRKTKSNPNHEASFRPRRPKPPSWQDQPPPSVTITEPPSNDAQSAAVAVEKEKSAALKEESMIAALGLEADARGLNRRSGLSRAHLKRTRSRVIDTREIPKEDPVIPLSRTQRHEFHLKETHHDNEIYLTENARRCRKWLANLEVGDLRDENPVGLSGLPDSNDTISFDLEVSNERWRYLGSPYPSDSESGND